MLMWWTNEEEEKRGGRALSPSIPPSLSLLSSGCSASLTGLNNSYKEPSTHLPLERSETSTSSLFLLLASLNSRSTTHNERGLPVLCMLYCFDTAGNLSFLLSSSSAVRTHASLLNLLSPCDSAINLRQRPQVSYEEDDERKKETSTEQQSCGRGGRPATSLRRLATLVVAQQSRLG
jgi:hypothetical protein